MQIRREMIIFRGEKGHFHRSSQAAGGLTLAEAAKKGFCNGFAAGLKMSGNGSA
jgi:hypothetical protein